MGICGGYQMLGRELSDPQSVEHGGRIRGIGLLDIVTVFMDTKHTVRVRGRIKCGSGIFGALRGTDIEGYEIHMGDTEERGEAFAGLYENGTVKPDGAVCGNVYGTYVHGIFDSAEVVTVIVSALMERKGLSAEGVKAFDMKAYKETQYDKLAMAVRENTDIDRIYEIIGV